VITPRIGKPVEVNALWHAALSIMALLSRKLNQTKVAKDYQQQASFVADNFRRRFWLSAEGYLCDVIDGPGGDPGFDGKLYDRRLRPNQILAVSLPFNLLTDQQAKAVVDSCTQSLLTPYGLRTLAPHDPAYVGHYEGNQYERDAGYHQGTVWSWLMGPFVKAHLRVYRDPVLAQSYLQPLIAHLADSGAVGTVSEIFDGDPPFTPRGCFARAWSVAELLEAWRQTMSLS
jgi:predicted glycogen debranching enzyme